MYSGFKQLGNFKFGFGTSNSMFATGKIDLDTPEMSTSAKSELLRELVPIMKLY